MTFVIRPYLPDDYNALVELYMQTDLYGGQFDTARDSQDRLDARIAQDRNSILVAEQDGRIVGTVSLIEDSRIAWLFRFAVAQGEQNETIRKSLYEQATAVLKQRGHSEVLVYAPDERRFEDVYATLGLNKGGLYRCFWQSLS